ncbi:MAG: hypothetical protein IKZ45_03715 [Fibrobacter sp.]|jgi:hypothetical protein|nr:hypothetical protein [Fibrobacter sp.]
MKTKIVYLASLLCALTFATSAFADSENGFYEKDHIRGFISLGADYRGMSENFEGYVNTIGRMNEGHYVKDDSTGKAELYKGSLKYSPFEDYYIGIHFNVGAQYKQFLTWFNINFMPTQISERPAETYTVTSESGKSMKMPLFDVKWFTYGVDWMFAWKLFGEHTFINLIPAAGFGFSLMNIHTASIFSIGDASSYVDLRDRYYSTFDGTLTAELELRLEFDPIAIGIYGGYRHVDYSDLEIESSLLDWGPYDTDNDGNTWFVGLRVTWIFMSDWQRKQADKL